LGVSKAFTREDDAPEIPLVRKPASALPPGAKNYITVSGERRLREELRSLVEARSSVAGDKAKLASADQQILHLENSLRSAVVVPAPAPEQRDQVLFGATVTVREPNGDEACYRIVGVDETDIDRDWVSWVSPIAKALLNRKLGERIRFKFPSGEKNFEIVAINYEQPD
jgi:transcription elongation factor GreB